MMVGAGKGTGDSEGTGDGERTGDFSGMSK